jgi:acyl-CoA synthetase (AMP-forming)/AMP-acid ligase II/acyl carrier protein
VSAEADYRLGVPIGRPVDGVEVLILRDAAPVPIGVDGEICLGGAVLARGYVGQPGLTAQHFVPHPWRPGERLYRTGDLGRWRADGAVDYVGRLNHEVKVRGHRVSPGEVERVMLEHPRVGQACVSGYRETGGDGGLCGYYAAGVGLELWPSLAEFFVYDRLLYGAMAGHRERNERYRAAFAKVLAGRTVVEIGPGPEAILARLCVEAGARRVYCVELLRETYEQAMRTVRALGLADRIVVLHGDVRSVSLPEPADYCVSEIVGSLGGAEGAALLINAARRLLRPGGGMIPSRAVTRLAAVSLPEGLELAFPETAAHYVEQVFAQKGYRFDLRLCLKHAARRHLLSSEDVLEDLDFTREVAAEASHAVELRFTRDGAWHGFLAWLELHTDGSEVLDTLDSQESWLPVYLPLSLAGVSVSAGDVFRGRVERRLSGNGLNPDYRIEGVLERQQGPAEAIAVVSRHDAPVYRGSAFYRALFAGEEVPVSRPPEPTELRAYLARRLPRYMVPGRLVRLARLPLTTSGKVDRAALPAAAPETMAETMAAAATEPPRDAVEAAVAAIWREVLEGAQVGLRDNFFDAGGHSLRLVQVHQRLEARFGPCLTPVELFQFPTIEATANLIRQRTTKKPNTTHTDADKAAVPTAEPGVREAGVREALRLQAGLRRAHRAPVATGSGVG